MNDIISDYQIKADKSLLDYLRPRTTERLSKLDAYCELMNMATDKEKQSEETRFGTTVHLHKGQFTITVTELAKKWNWHRVTVKSFLNKLVAMDYAEMFSEGKFFVITMHYIQPLEKEINEVPFSKDEQKIVRWLSGYIGVEEIVSSGVDFFKDTDALFKPQVTDSKADAGSRLHRLVSHLILSHSNLIPEQEDVNVALASLFCEHCHYDFIKFWCLLSLGSIHFSNTQNVISKPPLVELPDEVKQHLEVIFTYYGTLLRSPLSIEK